MKGTLLYGFLSSPSEFVNQCSPGYRHKEHLSGLMCMTSKSDAATCNGECCEKDKASCGGIGDVQCAFDEYAEGSDEWKRIPTNDELKNKRCCTKKASCASTAYTCKPYQKKQVSHVLCPGGPTSCALSEACCKTDAGTCGGMKAAGNTCGIGKTESGSDEAWQKKLSGAGYATSCCTDLTCQSTGYECPAGTKQAPLAAGPQAWGAATLVKPVYSTTQKCTIASKPSDCWKECCVANENTCGGLTMAGKNSKQLNGYFTGRCDTTTTYTPEPAIDNEHLKQWRSRMAGADPKASCCLPKPKCATHTCKSGYKLKQGKADAVCTTLNQCDSQCCEVDDQKCGGVPGISCPYGFYDESQTWILSGSSKTSQAVIDAWKNKPATAATRNVDCCTPREPCRMVGTTTPFVAPSTTPMLEALKYTQQKLLPHKKEGRAPSAILLWTAAGSFAGMAVIMVVKSWRSRIHGYSRLEVSEIDSPGLE